MLTYRGCYQEAIKLFTIFWKLKKKT